MTDHFLKNDKGLTPANAVVAFLTVEDGRYLMQLRSQKAGIFYPGHWGLFGGAVEAGEDADAALERELQEELNLDVGERHYFTEFTFDFAYLGLGRLWRRYYTVPLPAAAVPKLVLGEGSAMQLFSVAEALTKVRVVPYDAFAMWLHANR